MKKWLILIYLVIGVINSGFANAWWHEKFHPFYSVESDFDLIAFNIIGWPFSIPWNLSHGAYSCGFLLPFAEYKRKEVTVCRMD